MPARSSGSRISSSAKNSRSIRNTQNITQKKQSSVSQTSQTALQKRGDNQINIEKGRGENNQGKVQDQRDKNQGQGRDQRKNNDTDKIQGDKNQTEKEKERGDDNQEIGGDQGDNNHGKRQDQGDNNKGERREGQWQKSSYAQHQLDQVSPPSYARSGNNSLQDNMTSSNMASHESTTNEYDDNKYKIFESIKTLFNIIVPILILCSYFLSLSILCLCIINVIVLIILIIYYFIKDDRDTIIKDTLKYKLLKYVDYLISNFDSSYFKNIFGDKTANSKEPFFYLFNINFFIVVIFLIYIVLFIFYFGSVCIYLLFKLVFELIIGINTDSIQDNEVNIFQKYITLETFFGLIFAIIVYFYYSLIFKNIIHPNLVEVRSAIHKIDVYIQNEISKYGSNISADLLNTLINKGKDNTKNVYEEFNKYILLDIGNKNYDGAKQKLILITLYSHIYDNIPDTNQEALKLINYYFFEDPEKNKKDVDVKKNEEQVNELTYISLMSQAKGITPVKKIYELFDFYSMDSKEVKNITDEVDLSINTLNEKLQGFPEFKNTLPLFGIYIFVMLIIVIILVLIFNSIILYSKNNFDKFDYRQVLTTMAKAIDGILSYAFPQIVPLYLAIRYPDANNQCIDLKKESIREYKQCMNSAINTNNNDNYTSNEDYYISRPQLQS